MNVFIATKPIVDIDTVPCDTDDPAVMPTEHLEAQICELAGHITAATARYLDLVADFDLRQGWASWEMKSCAAWLAWKCQIAPNTAREHVRVARALKDLTVTHGEFAAARLSYAKVRALSRIATPENEADLAEMALVMTAGQLDQFVRAHAAVSSGEQDGRPVFRSRKLTWSQDQSGMRISLQLPPSDAAVILQALRAMTGDLDHSHAHEDDSGPPRTREQLLDERDAVSGLDWKTDCTPRQKNIASADDLADAMVAICGEYLSGRVASADNPDIYQVIIHAGTGAITNVPRAIAESAPAEAPTFPETHPRLALAQSVLGLRVGHLIYAAGNETPPALPNLRAWRPSTSAAVAAAACAAAMSAARVPVPKVPSSINVACP
jgi:hypothetical protein